MAAQCWERVPVGLSFSEGTLSNHAYLAMANGPKHFDSEQTAAYSESISSAAGTKAEHKKEPEVKHQCPIFHNIIESTSNINEFLAQFAPTATVPPKCPDRKFTAKLYTGKGRKQNVCNQLVGFARGTHWHI